MKIYEDHKMKELSNMKVGGIAKRFIEIEKKDEIIEIVSSYENIFILGNGTNTLFSDEYMDINFVSLKKLNKVEKISETKIKAESGLDFEKLIEYARSNNLGGLEDLTGIPGSVGGLVYMNGGAYNTEIFDCIESVEVIDRRDKKIKVIKKKDLEFSYRSTEIQEKDMIVLSTTFELSNNFNSDRSDELKLLREGRHPLDMPNLGSTFKNPQGDFSARLIIEAGLQGRKIGDAQISNVHPNFIVNNGLAKAKDVKDLVKLVKKEIDEKFNIKLKEEIIIIRGQKDD